MKMKITFYLTALLFLGFVNNSNGQTDNTFAGDGAGVNSTGNYNSGFGKNALNQNTSHSNSAFGAGALKMTSGGFNCAFGNSALTLNSTGSLNAAFGTSALYNNSSGISNVAIGHRAMEANVAGNYNTSIGFASSLMNVGSNNVALGYYTPRHLTRGNGNIFVGSETAINLKTGNFNMFLGGAIAVEKTPSTPFRAGNDTNNTIILADGAGNQRVLIHKNGNTGIGLGNNVIPTNKLDVKGAVVIGKNYTPGSTLFPNGNVAPANGLLVEGNVGIGNLTPRNKVEITHGTQGNSGLRFTNLTSDYNPTTAQNGNKFLTVNATGDVVLQRMPNVVNANAIASNGNVMTSTVNNIPASANIVNSIANTVNSSNQLVTTVNGVASAPVTLPIPTVTPQTLTQIGNVVTLSNGGGSFTLPSFDDTDGQSLTLTGNVLSISNGNSVILPSQTPQTLSQVGNVVTLSNGGGTFTLPSFNDTDGQNLTLTGNTLSISNGNSVTLPAQVPQTISQSGNTITLSNGGGSFTLPSTTTVVAGTNVSVSGNGSTSTPYTVSAVDKSIYADNGTLNQATTIAGNRVVTMNDRNIWFKSAAADTNGKIYIGTTATYPTTTGAYKLFVEGGIMTEKVKVALRSTSNWADYVFENDYKLMPLKDVEAFVTTNKHLPGIKSAKELAESGIDLAEMQSKQMEKIEELTLYIIDQDKKIEAQTKAIDNNTKEIEFLKAQIKALIEKTK